MLRAGPAALTKRDQRGVTMVELMVAMILMAVALLGLAASVPYALYGVVASGFQTTATLLAQEAIERAKAADYGSIPALSFDGSSGALPADCDSTGNFHNVSGFAGFTRCVAVQAATPTSTTTTITVVVDFSGSVPNPIYKTTVVTIRGN
jgi:prepilin-type N-terminal cleavage/methylation domain-containing protein